MSSLRVHHVVPHSRHPISWGWKLNSVLYLFFRMPTTGCLSTSASLTSSFFPFSIDSSSYLKPKPTMCDIGCAGHNPPTAIKHFFFSLLQYSGNCALKYSLHQNSVFLLPWGIQGTKVTWNESNYPHGQAGHHALILEKEVRSFLPPRRPSLSRSTSATNSPPISARTVISLRPCCHLL